MATVLTEVLPQVATVDHEVVLTSAEQAAFAEIVAGIDTTVTPEAEAAAAAVPGGKMNGSADTQGQLYSPY